MNTRIVRYLAECGVASRRAAADFVRDGVVAVNGEVVSNLALRVGPTDRVTVRGRLVRPPAQKVVLMLNKPAGVVCSLRDPHNPRTVLDCVPPEFRKRVKPVGRLDKETTGLLLLTDDGDLAYRLTHPRYGVEKTYRATVDGRVPDEAARELRDGVFLDDGPTAPAKVRLARYDAPSDRSTIEVTIHEGRNRQVRRMCEAVGLEVIGLERAGLGPLSIGGLALGRARLLTADEVAALRQEKHPRDG